MSCVYVKKTEPCLIPRLPAGKDGNKHLGLDIERVQYWLSVGAQPSQTVARLLGQAAIIPKPPPPAGVNHGPKDKKKR